MGHHAVAIYPSRTRWLIKVGERQNRKITRASYQGISFDKKPGNRGRVSGTGKDSAEAITKDSTPVTSAKNPPGYPISHPPIRALYGLRLSVMMFIFANDLRKTLHYYTNF
jgi:hypothetical protein